MDTKDDHMRTAQLKTDIRVKGAYSVLKNNYNFPRFLLRRETFKSGNLHNYD